MYTFNYPGIGSVLIKLANPTKKTVSSVLCNSGKLHN